MAITIILDTFPVSCTSKPKNTTVTETDICRDWISECSTQGNPIYVPEICYYEALRELERTNATVQIARLKTFCFAIPNRYIPITTNQIEEAAKLWAQVRNMGKTTASNDSIDADMILIVQALSLGLPTSDFVIATTNVKHIGIFAPAQHWKNIIPGA
jgi:predicted nucleic acid-binding protein